MKVGNDTETVQGHSTKCDKQKRQSPIVGSWRSRKAHYYANLYRTIILVDSHTVPEEGQDYGGVLLKPPHQIHSAGDVEAKRYGGLDNSKPPHRDM